LNHTPKTAVFVSRLLAVFLAAGWLFAQPALSIAGIKRVAIMPFKVNAEKELSYLSNGILSMLSSRISWDDRVVVADTEEIIDRLDSGEIPGTEQAARDIGKRMGVDYVLYGSLTLLGASVSIDAKMVAVSGGTTARSFYRQSSDMDGIIPQINLLAEEINEQVFDRASIVRQVPNKPPGTEASIYTHPERLLVENPAAPPSQPGVAREPVAAAAPSPAKEENVPAPIPATASVSTQFWKSRDLSMEIRGLALGDIDGDGKTEAAVISSRMVTAFRLERSQLSRLAEIKAKSYQQYLSVDVADINDNGRAEIFVTAMHANTKGLISFVLEWNGRKLTPIAEKEKWYYRVHHDPERGPLLLGQKRSYAALFFSDVKELEWDGTAYQPGRTIDLPEGTHLYGFAQGRVTAPDRTAVLAFDDDDRLRIFAPDGELQWKSDDRYGGSELALERMEDPEELTYLPLRLILTDLDKNGVAEAITVSNHGTTNRYFKQYRRYNSGRIESLSWNGLGLSAAWQTQKISGYISDFALQDLDNDGKLELVASVVSRQGSFFKKTKSALIAYDMENLGSGR